MELPYAEPYKTKTVERIYRSDRREREGWIKAASYNLFNLRSDQVYIDLLTDSGTGAMSDRQWAEIMKGDESYAGSSSYYLLEESVDELLGFDRFLPVHQGRGAENVLFSTVLSSGDLIPGNKHFDTTKGHIEYREAKAVDCTVDRAKDPSTTRPFKGNIDLKKLRRVFEENPGEKIPLVVLTVTCNSVGGQPVSLENIRQASEICQQYNTPLFLDAARFAENAYFIKTREPGYGDVSIRKIVREMFSNADGFTMSAKKDGIVNIGGLLGIRSKELYEKARVQTIMNEGFITYGGMAGRDMAAMAQGLKETTDIDYLESRIKTVHHLGEQLEEYGLPVLKPFGGHAIYVDAERVFPQIPQEQLVAQLLGVELYIEAGVRGVEIGTLLADRDPDTGENRYPDLELLRLAVPRRVYTDNHMEYVAAGLRNVYDRRDEYEAGLKIVKEPPVMRHFTVELERVGEAGG
ncbi:MAG: tryptophanase [Candidatus Bipolaricaulota bacterium]